MAMFGSNSTVLVGKWGQETRTTGVVDEVEDSCSMSGFDRSSLFAQRAKGLFPDFGENFFVQRPSAKCKGPLQKVQRALSRKSKKLCRTLNKIDTAYTQHLLVLVGIHHPTRTSRREQLSSSAIKKLFNSTRCPYRNDFLGFFNQTQTPSHIVHLLPSLPSWPLPLAPLTIQRSTT